MSYDLHPGPMVDDVLFLKDSHRARDIFNNREVPKLVFRRADQKFFSFLSSNPITDNVKRYIDIAGFGGVIDSGYRNLDHGLLQALIERWRPETHTFHLPIGEVTVTLEDINVLWGLPIEGEVVSGCEQPSSLADRIVRCHTLIGLTPNENDLKGNAIKLTAIFNHLHNNFSENASDFECMQRARCIILYLCGGTFFSDSSNNIVSLSILNNLEDLTACGHLSWGSAVLAMLYRNLCKAASNNSTNIGGPLYILQLWAWSRITTLALTILHEFDNRRPYYAMWREKLTYKDVSHSLRACRSQLQTIREGEFKWRPYEQVIGFLPGICRSGIRSWQSECFLIYWDVVEFHTPQRVMRQFGMVQRIHDPIPISFNEHRKLHTLIRTGKPDNNWPNIHSKFLSVWNQRWENVVQGMDGISQTYQQAGQFMHMESTLNFQNFETLQNTANQERKKMCNVRSGAGTSSAQHQNYQAGTSNVEHENFEAGTSHVQHENYELDPSQFSNAPSPSFFSGINQNMMFEHNNEQEVYTPQISMLPLFTQPDSENFNYYAPQFSPNYAQGFSGISPLPALDLNLHMSVRDLDDETFLANTLNAEDVDVDQNTIASRRRNPHRHRRRPGCGT
ncbi:hypothetical protein E3N88_38949 [Mikania micrantha]|uniref:Aminotransferase-like plant mobile domain-containing protein n=1 Tax=Mikania micrantha TaxID=192012 RepID=A0A5N6LXZ2_9ASTR|nr:hypothetical protein E3N88_38949 [Mikania micrantha]